MSAHDDDEWGEWQDDLPWPLPTADFMLRRLDGVIQHRFRNPPKIETVTLCWTDDLPGIANKGVTMSDTHVITFNLIGGEPDCTSIKMERLK